MKKILKNIYNVPSAICNRIAFVLHKSKLYSNVKINGRLRLYGKGRLILGNGVRINSRYRNNPIGGQTFTSIYIKPQAIVEIGDNTGISNAAIYAAVGIKIGKNVKIGGDVKIFDTDFHSLDYEVRRSPNDTEFKSKQIQIEDDVFIGASSIILKGVTIGARSIIGAGSVVTKSIPPGEIWAGNPAKFIRTVD